jgi:hypothetical protein
VRFLIVKNWEKFQHQDGRKLPWIKFFTALLEPTRDPAYALLPDTAKVLLHHIWLMARVFNNRIPEDWLTRERLNLQSRVNLAPLLDSGFLWFESDSTSLTRAHRASNFSSLSDSSIQETTTGESEGDRRKRATEPFETLWSDYPRKRGREKAFDHFVAQIRTPEDLEAIRSAVSNYRLEIQILGCEERYVMHGATFFNRRWRDYRAGVWTPPLQAETNDKQRRNPDPRHSANRPAAPGQADQNSPPRGRERNPFGQRTLADLEADGTLHPVPNQPAGEPSDPVRGVR